jgi:predicted transcriptional regulator
MTIEKIIEDLKATTQTFFRYSRHHSSKGDITKETANVEEALKCQKIVEELTEILGQVNTLRGDIKIIDVLMSALELGALKPELCKEIYAEMRLTIDTILRKLK